MKILVIEDENNIRENTVEILELKGYEVKSAANGEEGLDVFKAFLPDFVLCDVMMPILDGYAFFEQIKKLDHLPAVPLVFLSAKAEPEEYKKAIKLGAVDFLTKPYSFDELFELIDKYKR